MEKQKIRIYFKLSRIIIFTLAVFGVVFFGQGSQAAETISFSGASFSGVTLSNPQGIAIVPAGTVDAGKFYVVNGGNSTVYRFKSDGTSDSASFVPLSVPGALGGVAVDALGNIYVPTVTNVSDVYVCDSDCGGKNESGHYDHSETDSINVFDATGALRTAFGSYGVDLNHPTNAAVISSGNNVTVYATNSLGNNISKFTSTDGGASFGAGTTFGTGTTFNAPAGVAVDSLGNVYVADRTNLAIKKFNAAGTLLATIATYGGANFVDPYSIAVDPTGDGHIYVGDYGANKIIRLAGSGSSYPTAISGPATSPWGLAVDDAGGSIFATDSTGTVKRFITGDGGIAMTAYDSAVKDFPNTALGNMTWTASESDAAGTTAIKMRVRSAAAATGTAPNLVLTNPHVWSDTCNVATSGTDISANPCVVAGARYVQYEAILSTVTGTKVPYLTNVSIEDGGGLGYSQAFLNLISSPFDTTNANNSVQKITWTRPNNNDGTDEAKGTIKFQIKTASSQANLANALWCGPTVCSTTPGGKAADTTTDSDFYTDKLGATDINATQKDYANDQWIQYATFLKSADGTATPTLSNVTMQYSYNTPAVISNADAVQQTSGSYLGSVNMSYTLAESLDDAGHIPHGSVTTGNIYERLFYQPNSGVKLSGTLNAGYTGALTFANASNPVAPIPSQGMMLVGDELMSFTGGTTTSVNITGRGKYLDDPSTTYKTTDAGHSTDDAIYFLATKNTAGGVLQQTINTLSDASPSTTQAIYPLNWDPRAEQYLNLNGNIISSAMNFRIVAHDADSTGVNNMSSATGATVSGKTLDLQPPTISSITASPASGTKIAADQITLTINFSENITTNGTGLATLNTTPTRTCSFSGISGASSALCVYAVQVNDVATNLSVTKVEMEPTKVIKDQFGNILTNFTPASNVASGLNVDAVPPTLSNVHIQSNNANNQKAKVGDVGGVVTLSMTASESLTAKPTVTIAGHAIATENVTGTNPYSATYTMQTGDTEGSVPFTVDFSDVVGNAGTQVTAVSDSSVVTFDKTKPTLTAVHISSNNANNQKAKVGDVGGVVTLSMTASETLSTAPVVTIAGQSASVSGGSSNVYTATYTMAQGDMEGNVPFLINFSDSASNAGDAVSTVTDSSAVVFDKTAPVLSLGSTIVARTNDITPDYNFTSSEAGAITYAGGCKADAIPNATSGVNSITFDALAENTYNCSLTVTDAAGNISSTLAVAEFTVDTHGTDIDVQSPSAGDHVKAFNVTFFNDEDITSGNILLTKDGDLNPPTKSVAVSAENFTSGQHTQAIADVSGLTDGTYTVAVAGKDLAGNDMYADGHSGVIYDTTAPTATLTVDDFFNNYSNASDISYAVVNNIFGTDEALQSLTLTFARTGGNPAADQVCNLTKIATDLNVGAHSAVNLANSCSQEVVLVDGAEYSIDLQAVDRAGNTGDAVQKTNITFDTTAPILTSFTSTKNSPPVYGVGDTIDVTAHFTDAGLVKAGSKMRVIIDVVENNVYADLVASENGTTMTGSFQIQATTLRTYDTARLNVKSVVNESAYTEVEDLAGNKETEFGLPVTNLADSNNIQIDTGGPILIGLSATSGQFKKNGAITFTANYSEALRAGSKARIKINADGDGEFVDLDSVNGSQLSTSTNNRYIVKDGDNAESLQILSFETVAGFDAPGDSVRDLVGDVGNPSTIPSPLPNDGEFVGTQIDTIAPELGTTPISIANQNGKTSSATPTITLSATDNYNLSKAVFSLNGGTGWCTPIDYNATITTFDITSSSCGGNTANGNKTVTVKFRDAATNESATASADIYYDNVKPQIQTFATDTAEGVYGPDTAIKIIATYDENITSGTLTVQLDNGKQVTLGTIENDTQLTGTYTVGGTGSGEDTGQLRVASVVSQSVSDTSDPANVQNGTSLSGITGNLDAGKTIQIDNTAPTGSVVVNRSKDSNQIHINATDSTSDGMTVQISSPSSYTGNCQLSSNPADWLVYADNIDSTLAEAVTPANIRKVCAFFKDKYNNVSEAFSAVTPETPTGTQIDDISNSEIPFYGSMLTWSIPVNKGTTDQGGDPFKQYEIFRCASAANSTDECIPDISGNNLINDTDKIVISKNYFVDTALTADTTYCYELRFKDQHGDYSKLSSNTCFQAGHAPVVTDSQVTIISGNPDDIQITDVTEQGATVIYQTRDSKYNRPIATKGKIEVYTDATLTSGSLVKTTTEETDFIVMHSTKITGLVSGTPYYLKIIAQDSSVEGNAGRVGVLAYSPDGIPALAFTTLGTLKEITGITETVITDSKAVINFQTDQEAKCFIDFKDALSSTYNDLSDNLETDFMKNHVITLTQLIFKTNYDYKITCTDKMSVSVTSSEHHFTTLEKGLTQGELDSQKDSTAPVISSVAIPTITGESATITWNTDENANSLVSYQIQGADFMSMGGDHAVNQSVDTYSTSHTVTINNLLSATAYTFSVMSIDKAGNVSQSSESTLTTKQPSELSSIKVISTALGEATVTWSTGSATSSTVEYGLTTAYGQKKADSAKTKEHSMTITGLTPGDLYHMRVLGDDGTGNIFASSDITFQPKAPPKISNFKIDSIFEHGATVSFLTNVPTDALVTYTDVANGENSGFQGNPTVTAKHEIKLKDITSGSTFGTKVAVKDEDGNTTEETFPNFTTTKDETPPTFDRIKTDSALTQNDKVQAIISWTTNELASGDVLYREGRNGDEKTFVVNDTPSFSHVGVITSFKPGTVYYFKVRSTDVSGNKGFSTDYALLTPKRQQNIIQIIVGNFQDIFGWASFAK